MHNQVDRATIREKQNNCRGLIHYTLLAMHNFEDML